MKPRHKFNATKTEYAGRKYDSKKEAAYAEKLAGAEIRVRFRRGGQEQTVTTHVCSARGGDTGNGRDMTQCCSNSSLPSGQAAS